MQKGTIRIKLLTIFASLLIGLAISSTATAQDSSSASTSPTIPVAVSCEEQLRVANERLAKTLDAYEKATKAFAAATDEIQARIRLDVLKDELLAVKDQLSAVKDLIIADQDKLIDRLQKNSSGFMSRLKSILKIAEKVVLIGLGIYLGGR